MPAIRATYRVQLHAGFDLLHAAARVPYLARLGVSHLHCSPLYRARPGSTHGYDVVDPTTVNPELGGIEGVVALEAALSAQGIGAVLDIVPNHMATAPENTRWTDVLAHGPASPYARWFDIDWRTPARGLRQRVLLPILGDQPSRVLARGELQVVWERGRLQLAYYEHRLPLDPATLPAVLASAVAECGERVGADDARCAELREVVALLRALPRRSVRSERALARRRGGADAALDRLAALAAEAPPIAMAVVSAAAAFGSGPDGPKRLRRLLDAQAYALVHWRHAARELNYRRFFDVNDLVALHMEDPEVFREHHVMVLDWMRRGWVDGLRIDHPDGLLDPLGYLRRLVDAAFEWRPDGRYPVFVEKILAAGERLRESWPVAGTTGYDFLNDAEALFIDPEGFARLEADYRRIARRTVDFATAAREGKRRVLEAGLSAGVRRLAARIAQELPEGARLPAHDLSVAIVEVIVALPVYRTYADERHPQGDAADRALLDAAFAQARRRGRAKAAALDAVERSLLGPGGLRLLQRFQQLSGPAAAKGVEDTALYVYPPLHSRNEVGGAPDAPLPDAVTRFHESNAYRRRVWPGTMLAVTTHDTKRSADVRARLDVLSEMPERWEERLYHWRRWNRRHTRMIHGRRAPDAATEYFLYQTLVGVWPLGGLAPEAPAVPDAACLTSLRERVRAYAEKAVREAKEHTEWIDPDPEYEAAVAEFVDALLTPASGEPFLSDLVGFVAQVARPGLWNSLARTALWLTAPGVPDIYQGDELWNFSLVDPDNRRPVDFERLAHLLGAVDADPAALMAAPEDGRIKLRLIHTALAIRARDPALLHDGSYEPLAAEGPLADRVIGFRRRFAGRDLVVAVPRLARHLLVEPALTPTPTTWRGTALRLPDELHGAELCRPLGGAPVRAADGALPLDIAFDPFPVALLLRG